MTEVHLGFVWKGQQRQAGARKQRGVYIWFGFSDCRVHLFRHLSDSKLSVFVSVQVAYSSVDYRECIGRSPRSFSVVLFDMNLSIPPPPHPLRL
jgi:hypothetical protein